MLAAIKKSAGFFDYVLLLVAFYMFSHFDYSNLETVEIVYIVSFALWFAMLCFRIYITFKSSYGKEMK